MLTFSTTVPEDFAGQTVGLVGNFDGDDKNDFILPNGTILTENQTRTEKQIFYNFGEHYFDLGAINNTESVFKYFNGKSPDDYRDRDFIPIFIEDFEQEDVVKATTVCGNKTSSATCIYDYLLTKDEGIGKDSGRVKVEAIETVKSSENKVPVIWGDRSVNATIGIPTKIEVHGSDDGSFSYRVISGPKTNFNFDETKSFYMWTPNDTTPINISITVIDNSGLAATPLDIQVTMCGNCSNHGYCMFNETVPKTTLFEYAKCVCEQGWTGYQCENDVNGCSGHPCSDGRNCTDLTPAEEANFGRSFNCSSCPKGYTENDKNKCSGFIL
ncbi:hypothetical protein KUTeg_015412 [Tegillarca granosa]|uniref:VWFD domain-containing protein n=1 Tax=Tegillarca granosa TaxID=220873 RepID=A0ABQ9EQ27_TEGGR|nr:hypothetical protein KUTeg_015412 [Tegillarca granosa]